MPRTMPEMTVKVLGNLVTIENATDVFWKNFSGNKDNFGSTKRKFTLGLTEDAARILIDLGVNVRASEQSEESDFLPYHVTLTINYRGEDRDPTVSFLRDGKRRMLNDATISLLDYQTIVYVDVTANLYRYQNNVTLYVTTMYARLMDEPLAEKYADWTIDEE